MSMLKENRTLRDLSLRNNGLGDKDGQLLYDGVGNHLYLESLDLSENHFTESEFIGQIIENNSSLKTLKLSWNKLRLGGITVRVQIC